VAESLHNAPRLELHIPQPPTRAEGRFSFDGLNPGKAGAVRRPDPLTDEKHIRDMPFAFIRVLDDDGNACGPWKPTISVPTLL
jgi:2-oxoisovalerate dehydrogenase E1 component alpha subunit